MEDMFHQCIVYKVKSYLHWKEVTLKVFLFMNNTKLQDLDIFYEELKLSFC